MYAQACIYIYIHIHKYQINIILIIDFDMKVIISKFKKFLLQLLYNIVLISKVKQQKYIRMPLLFGFPSHLGYHRALSRVPSAIEQVLTSYIFHTWYQQCIHVNKNLPVHPAPLPSFLISIFVFYFYVSISALQLFTIHCYCLYQFLQIPHICINIQYLFFFLTSVYTTVFRSRHISTNDPILFLFMSELQRVGHD